MIIDQIGKKINNLRLLRGWTQKELAERIKVDVRTIQRIEAGDVYPRTYTLRLICEVLNTTFEELSSELSDASQKRRLPALYWKYMFGWIGAVSLSSLSVVMIVLLYVIKEYDLYFKIVITTITTFHWTCFLLLFRGYFYMGAEKKKDILRIACIYLLIPLVTISDAFTFINVINNQIPWYQGIPGFLLGTAYIIWGVVLVITKLQDKILANLGGAVQIISGILLILSFGPIPMVISSILTSSAAMLQGLILFRELRSMELPVTSFAKVSLR